LGTAGTQPEPPFPAPGGAGAGGVLVLARGARTLRGIRRTLGLVGSAWTVVGALQDALEYLEEQTPDLILVDLCSCRSLLPGLFGDLRRVCRAPILLVSGQALDRRDRGPLLRLADGVVASPASAETLADMLAPAPAGSDPRLPLLLSLGTITRSLAFTADPRAVHEQLLDLVHCELGRPCALLATEPRRACLACRGEEGRLVDLVGLLGLISTRSDLHSGEVQVIEADPEGSDLAAWCAGQGLARAALAPIRGGGRFRGAFLVLASTGGGIPFGSGDLEILSTVSGQAAVLLDNLELHQVARARQAMVEKLLEKVINAQEEERKWLAAEVHDTIAQSLVGMHTMVQTCRQVLHGDPSRAEKILDGLRGLVTESLAEIRQILFQLRPASLDDLGLVPSLENYARRFTQSSGIRLALHLPGRNQTRLPPLLETTVFRITQEALSNIKKHSGARRARVALDVGTTDLRLTVADEGRGLVWSEVSERFQSGEGHGLHGMQERARLLGGTFRFSNDPGGGAILEVVIPLARPTPSDDFGFLPPEADSDLLLEEVLGGKSQDGIPAVYSRRTL